MGKTLCVKGIAWPERREALRLAAVIVIVIIMVIAAKSGITVPDVIALVAAAALAADGRPGKAGSRG